MSIFGNLLGLWRSLGVFGDLWGFDLLKVRLFSSHARCDFLVFSCKVHKTFWFLIQDEIWVFLSYMRLLGFLILHKTFCRKHQKTKTNNPIWSSLKNLPICSILNKFDLVWTCLNMFDQYRLSFNQFDPIWSSLNKFEQVWTSLNKFGQVWTSLIQFEHVWSSLN